MSVKTFEKISLCWQAGCYIKIKALDKSFENFRNGAAHAVACYFLTTR